MRIVPIEPIDNQQFSLELEGNSYDFRLKDTGVTGVFLDVYRDGQALITGVLCLDRVRIIRSAYLRFPGDLVFIDQNGFDNPQFTYFGTRFLLFHLEKSEENLVL